MRCPRCHLDTLELQGDGTMYLCRRCKYIQDNESAQFVTPEQFTETLKNKWITTQTVKPRRSIKKHTRRKVQLDDEGLKELRLSYNKYSRRLRQFSLPSKTLSAIWKRACSSVLGIYQHFRTIIAEDPGTFSSIHANFVANAILECQANGLEPNISSSSILTLLSRPKAMAIATYVLAAELAGELVMPSCITLYLESRDTAQKPPSLLLVSRCYRILPILILSPMTRARLLFDVRTAFTQIASLCLVFQGYKLDHPLITPWIELSTRLSTLYPIPLCGFHAFMPIPAASSSSSISKNFLSPCRYVCILLLLAYLSLMLARSQDDFWKYSSPSLLPSNLTVRYHNSFMWSTETTKFFKAIGLNFLVYKPFNSFSLEEFIGSNGAQSRVIDENSAELPLVDDVACMLAAICELSVERFVKSSLDVACALPSRTNPKVDQSKLG